MADELTAVLQAQVEQGIAILKTGGVIAFPTDTVFGLGSMISAAAVKRIYDIKGRPANLALPLLISRIDRLEKLAVNIPDSAWRMAEKFWPGALTLVLFKSGAVPDYITSGAKTVALRLPAHPVPVALAKGVGGPITGTSANLSGQPAAQAAAEARSRLGSRIDLIIEGGPPVGGKESTIVDMTLDAPVILRQGAITLAQLREIEPNIRIKGEPG